MQSLMCFEMCVNFQRYMTMWTEFSLTPQEAGLGFPLIDTHYHYHTHKHVKQSNSLQRTESDNVDFLMRLAIEQRRYA